jgi:hypothetical protein
MLNGKITNPAVLFLLLALGCSKSNTGNTSVGSPKVRQLGIRENL